MPPRQPAQESARLERRRLPNATAAERIVECGWGRLIAGHTFAEPQAIADALCDERPGQRDIAYYVDKPHVVISCAPQRLFLNPADAYRLWFDQYVPDAPGRKGFTIRRLQSRADIAAINAIYRARQMVRVDPSSVWEARSGRQLLCVLAEDATGDVLGVAMGVDHAAAFDDDSAEAGSSLWALAAMPDAPHAGIGEALTRYLAEQFQARGRLFMDLSVVHDNEGAIGLYEKLGFQPIKAFAVKYRNAISAELFSESAGGPHGNLGPHGQAVVDEARLRGVRVEVLDGENGYYRLGHAGRHVICRRALSELTSAIALQRSADHQVVTIACSLRPACACRNSSR